MQLLVRPLSWYLASQSSIIALCHLWWHYAWIHTIAFIHLQWCCTHIHLANDIASICYLLMSLYPCVHPSVMIVSFTFICHSFASSLMMICLHPHHHFNLSAMMLHSRLSCAHSCIHLSLLDVVSSLHTFINHNS